ncbi:MAG: TIM barrel protein [Candidatus Bathyarchaeota archaeon]|jgi:deoxyribonuclease-4|nr:TIM barrel protein [Candidatus Bathyarchaeota archaeon]
MADHPRFGPAGVPQNFKILKKPITDIPRYLHDERLDAFEYQAVRWGPKPQMKKENAEELGRKAVQHDVWLTLHGSYFVNLCGEAKIIEASKSRLLSCVTAADWMGADAVVFHPGHYGENPPKEALEICVKAMKEIVELMQSNGLTRVHLAPETAGRLSQLGNLEEILALCEKVELTEPNIDWSHLHARERGKLETTDDFRKIIDEIERRLGTDATRNLHCHYSHIEFTDKGERRHHTMDEIEYGPDFRILASLIIELGLKPVMICETPYLDKDAQKMRDILETLKTRES